jgi:uncharacterized protein
MDRGQNFPYTGPIIDPFVQLVLETDSLEIPMPREAIRDEESLENWPKSSLAGHLFPRDPGRDERDAISKDLDRWLAHLDQWGIRKAGIPLTLETPNEIFDRLSGHSDRIFATLRMNPHEGMSGIRRADHIFRTYPFVRSVSISPFMLYPQIAPSQKEYYPIYTKCCELDRPVFINVGMPGPRVPGWTQDPMHLDEVCWFFPELTVVMRHGGHPWIETCVNMLLRWPNLYYATTAYAPRYYSPAIMQLVKKRAPTKVIYAGYWPLMPFERIFTELAEYDFDEATWTRFMCTNAANAFGIEVPEGAPPTGG